MATLKTILALGSTIPNNVVSSSLLTTITKNNTVTAGGVLAITIDAITEGTAITLLTAGYHPLGTKVYLRNLETTAKTLKFKCTGDVNYEIILKPLQWAFFPWTASEDVKVFASAAGTRLEYGTFS